MMNYRKLLWKNVINFIRSYSQMKLNLSSMVGISPLAFSL